MPAYNFNNLTPREASILIAAIESYIDTCIPISSNFLKSNHSLSLSSATIRNVMSTLEGKGFLTHLYTSGGRVPTDIGYRYYVNSIQNLNSPDDQLTEDIKKELETISDNVEELLKASVKMLSKVSNMFGVVKIDGYENSILTDIELISIHGNRILLVLGMDNGLVKSIILNLDLSISLNLIKTATQLLKDKLIGLPIFEIKNSIALRLNESEIFSHELVQVIINKSFDKVSNDYNKSIYTSSANVLLDHPEFQNTTDFQRVLPGLDKAYLANYFNENFISNEPMTLIGKENKNDLFNDCSIITSSFKSNSINGRIGVIAPKRVNYIVIKNILENFKEIVQSAI